MSQSNQTLLQKITNIGRMIQRFELQTKINQKAPAQQRIINVVYEEEGITQSMLAEILDVKPSTLAETLKKLEEKKEIYRKEDKNDKRIKQIYLTQSGKTKVTIENENDFSEKLISGLSAEEQETLEVLLNKMINGWPKEVKAEFEKSTDPFERLAAIKEQLFKEFTSEEFQNLTSEEQMRIKREKMNKFKRAFPKDCHHHGPKGRHHRHSFDCDERQFLRPEDFDF